MGHTNCSFDGQLNFDNMNFNVPSFEIQNQPVKTKLNRSIGVLQLFCKINNEIRYIGGLNLKFQSNFILCCFT